MGARRGGGGPGRRARGGGAPKSSVRATRVHFLLVTRAVGGRRGGDGPGRRARWGRWGVGTRGGGGSGPGSGQGGDAQGHQRAV